VATWRDETPPGFCFAVKGSRFITHIKRLRDPQSALETYLERMEGLKSKLGPILFQLPPNWHVNTERLEEFLAALPWRRHHYVMEFRDPTWYTTMVYDLLRKYQVALCMHDWQGQRSPTELTTDHTYIRFHGATGKYQGNYTDGMLRTWAELIRQWIPRMREIRVYFNNDQGGTRSEMRSPCKPGSRKSPSRSLLRSPARTVPPVAQSGICLMGPDSSTEIRTPNYRDILIGSAGQNR
jgi:uncharacterized protein YecE (DUF72 family)